MYSSNRLTTSNSKKRADELDQVMRQLSEPLSRPRPRKPLSKFTVTTNPPSESFHTANNLIPAHRTCAKERLTIVSQDDKKKMSISPYTGMAYVPSSPSITTRNTLLQRKTIHRSLEDLGCAKNWIDQISTSPRSQKSIQLLSSNSKRLGNSNRNENAVKNTQMMGYIPQRHSQVQTDNIINTMPHNVGGSGDMLTNDFNYNDNNRNAYQHHHEDSIEDDRENISNLSVENEQLKKRVGEERRKGILYRIITAFTFEALRRRSRKLAEIEQVLQERRVECAARIVLHHLLLNSWRTTKGQVTAITMENSQMHKTIDNQSLQLNVIRKMQSIEKEKATTILKDYNEIKHGYYVAMKENEKIKEEYAKVLEEKNSLEKHLKGLTDENSRLNIDLRIRLDKKDMQLRSMELDRMRAEKFFRENEELTKEAEHAKSQVKELVAQQAQWQEKAMSYESQCFELKQEMENREKVYQRVLNEKKDITRENEILALSKSKLEKAVEEVKSKLVESTAQRKELETSYTECKEELEDLEDQVHYMQTILRQYKKENSEIRQKLYDCTLKNVQKRRVWGAALYFLVSPIEAFKRFYFGTPEQPQPPGKDSLGSRRLRIKDSM